MKGKWLCKKRKSVVAKVNVPALCVWHVAVGKDVNVVNNVVVGMDVIVVMHAHVSVGATVLLQANKM